MFTEHTELSWLRDLSEGDQVYLTEDVRTLEGIFTKGHEFTYIGDTAGGMWFRDSNNRCIVIHRLQARNINDTFTIKKVTK